MKAAWGKAIWTYSGHPVKFLNWLMERGVPTENNKLATKLYFELLWDRLVIVSPTEPYQLFSVQVSGLQGPEIDTGLHYSLVDAIILRDMAI